MGLLELIVEFLIVVFGVVLKGCFELGFLIFDLFFEQRFDRHNIGGWQKFVIWVFVVTGVTLFLFITLLLLIYFF